MSYQPPYGEEQPSGQPSYGAQPYGNQPAPYGQPMPPGGYWPAPVPQTNGMAIAALILTFVFTPLGLIFGYIARGQIKRTGEGGAGLATAAIIISWIFIAVPVIIFLIFFLFGVMALTVSTGY